MVVIKDLERIKSLKKDFKIRKSKVLIQKRPTHLSLLLYPYYYVFISRSNKCTSKVSCFGGNPAYWLNKFQDSQ